jgi:hypothetical protein
MHIYSLFALDACTSLHTLHSVFYTVNCEEDFLFVFCTTTGTPRIDKKTARIP